jgi:error-prone DNA polymerase
MGFYPVETLKQDARKFGVPFLNPCVNRSQTKCVPEGNSILLGLQLIKDVGKKNAVLITEERGRHGPYINAGDLVRRTGLKPQAVLSLVLAGAFDAVTPNRRLALWEAGLYERPTKSGQMVLPLSMDDNVPDIEDIDDYDKMLDEYETMGIYPKGHIMEFVRPKLSPQVLKTVDVETLAEGDQIMVAGWPIARQHPKGQDGTVFVTVEDEVGDTQLIIWPKVFERCRKALRSHVILARGVISKWDGTVNVVVSDIKAVDVRANMPRSHDWH